MKHVYERHQWPSVKSELNLSQLKHNFDGSRSPSNHVNDNRI